MTTNFAGVDVVPLRCTLVRGEGDAQFWRSGSGAIVGCVVVCYGEEARITNFGWWMFLMLLKMVFAIGDLCWYNLY